MANGIDFLSAGSISASAIASHGYNFAANYLGRGLTASVVNQYKSAGLAIVSIYEATVDFYHNGAYDPNSTISYDPNKDRTGYLNNIITYWDGYYQAQQANSYAVGAGQDPNSAIYFA